MLSLTPQDITRFHTKYTKEDGPCPDQCWIWSGTPDKRGYGRMLVGRVSALAHHVAFQIANNRESSTYVQRKCNNSLCVNPAHLYEDKNKGRTKTVAPEEMMRLYREGLNTTEIAKELCCSISLVQKRLKELKD